MARRRGPQTATGVVSATPAWLGSHPTDVDDPVTHSSFDFLVNVKPDAPSGFLLGTGNFAGAGESEEAGRLHTEWEQSRLPDVRLALARRPDKLTGNWVWDCGHWLGGGERTELHPIRAFWVQRQGVSPRSATGETEADLVISTDGTPAGASANCQHRTRGDKAAFKACLAADPGWQDVTGSYRFVLAAPSRPSAKARLRIRVVDAGSTAGAPAVKAVPGPKGVVVTVDVSTPPGRRVVIAKRVLAGWDAAPEPVHLRVTFDRILVRRSMDPGCIAPCTSVETTRVGQISKPPGEWTLYSDVAGVGEPVAVAPPGRRTDDPPREERRRLSRRAAALAARRHRGSATTAASARAALPRPRRRARPGPGVPRPGRRRRARCRHRRYTSPRAALGVHATDSKSRARPARP